MACEDETTLLKYAQGRLTATERERVDRHLDSCDDCRRTIAISADSVVLTLPHFSPSATPARAARGPAPDELKRGSVFGRYEVLERVGRGGMGVVYSAYDPQLHRKVALKLLSERMGASDDLAGRMLREAQAMAQLAHPNVVAVYDAGTVDGQVFIAMELVEGMSLRRWLARPRGFRAVLDAYLAAGRGLAAAHGVGLVHRDFKPDNVLISHDGEVRVTDFGLVRLAGETDRGSSPSLTPRPSLPQPDAGAALGVSLTQTGTLMGSAGYVAPEVFTGGAATVSSDQFSFCVALYEGLYGSLPFEGTTLEAMAMSARLQRLKPAARPDGAPGWVLKLLRRGLAPNPEQRFASLAALLDRLADDPTRGRRIAVAGITIVGVAIGLVGAFVHHRSTLCDDLQRQLGDAWAPAVRRQAAQAFGATGLPYAQSAWELAEAQLQRYADAWVAASTDACIAGEAQGTQSEHQHALRVSCLQRRHDELSALTRAFANADATVVEQAGNAIAHLPSIGPCSDLRALESSQAAISESLAEPVRAARTELTRARTLLVTGKAEPAVAAAAPLLQKAVELGVPSLVAEVALVLGDAQKELGDASCVATWEQGVSAATLAGEDELSLQLLAGLISERGWRRGKPAEARALFPVAEGVSRRLGGRGLAVGLMLEARADVEWQDAKYAEALALYRRSLEQLPRDVAGEGLDAARVHMSIGWTLSELGQFDAAEVELGKSADLFDRLVGSDHPSLAALLNALALLYEQKGNLDEAIRVYVRAIALIEASYGKTSPRLGPPLMNLASDLGDLGREAEALALIERVETMAAANAENAALRVNGSLVRGQISLGAGRAAEAVKHVEQALALGKEIYGPRHVRLLPIWYHLARAQHAVKRDDEALASVKQALALQDEAGSPTALQRGQLLEVLGQTQLGLGKIAEARAAFEGAIAAFDTAVGADRSTVGRVRLSLAEALWKAGEREAARTAALEAKALIASSFQPAKGVAVEQWLAAHPGKP